MIQKLRRLYFRLFKRYRRLEIRYVSYSEGDRLIRENVDGPEAEQWHIAKEEDDNPLIGMFPHIGSSVYLERRERITGCEKELSIAQIARAQEDDRIRICQRERIARRKKREEVDQ